MRGSMLLAGSFLALSVDAVPSFKVGRDMNKFKDGEAPTNTKKLPTMVRRNVTFPDWGQSCKTHNQKTWQDLKVDHWLNMYADGWFESDMTEYPDTSFPTAVMKQIGGFTPYTCSLKAGCHFDYDSTQVGCTTGEGTPAGTFDALWMFTLYGLSNFQSFMDNLYETFWNTANEVIGSEIDGMVDDFTSNPTADKTKSEASEGLIIISAVLGGLAALLGPLGEVFEAAAVGVGAAAGEFGVANGILLGTESAAIDFGLVEEERAGILKQKLSNTTDALRDSIRQYADNILQNAVDPSEYKDAVNNQYSDQTYSGPYALKDGNFAQPVKDGIFDDYEQTMKDAIRSGAISWLWDLEKVFVVAASKPINDKAPCDMDLSSDDLLASSCDKDTGFMYWFLKESSITYCTDEYDYAPGLGKIANYPDLSAVALAKAANASQATGGYKANYTMGSARDFLTGDNKPEMNLMVNVPVCNLDYFNDDLPSQLDVRQAQKMDTTYFQDVPTDEMWVRWSIHTVCPKLDVNGEAFPYTV
ncbi:hypothetical protein N7478_005815 [Penicillium angulare]|uniref:uncharacterized protein n=1 Tax=Penicillium angulare TaxID=116970 RepID=UPI0025412B16|nr:uncharacterized protein N7478_005815 [Penicillium angulare]KAJ5280443.1 hypothetical protein N7478_005815 [Penicillium angulare]